MMGWYPVFLREMLLFRKRLFKLGFVFSSLFIPFLYLLAFGLGLGGKISIQGQRYVEFLLPGLVAMSSMNNSYNSVAINLNMSRNYNKTFQMLIQAPLRPIHIVIGQMLAGMVRGIFASATILCAGFFIAGITALKLPFLLALLLNCVLFSALGIIVGMKTKNFEGVSLFNNFFIMPMAFFSGTFFPVERMPSLIKGIIYLLPLTHTNILIRKTTMDMEAGVSAALLWLYGALFLVWGANLIKNYSE